MFLVILLVIFRLHAAESAAAEEHLPWEVQQHIQARAITYNDQCKSEAIVNLRDDLDLWSLLVYNQMCGRKENEQSLAWVLSQKDGIYAEIEALNVDLNDYRANIELFEHMNDDEEHAATFAMWLSTTAQNNIEGVRDWTRGLETRERKLTQLHARLAAFYDLEIENVVLSRENIISFVLDDSVGVLGLLLARDPVETRRKVEKFIVDVFYAGE